MATEASNLKKSLKTLEQQWVINWSSKVYMTTMAGATNRKLATRFAATQKGQENMHQKAALSAHIAKEHMLFSFQPFHLEFAKEKEPKKIFLSYLHRSKLVRNC